MTYDTAVGLTDNAPAPPSYLDELKLGIILHFRRSSFSFRQLVLSMEGAYPTDILKALRALQDTGEVTASVAPVTGDTTQVAEMQDEDPGFGLNSDAGFVLPEPHPLDFDWRFAKPSLSVLSDVLSRFGGDRIATLGTPTLHLHLWKSGKASSLFDKNAHLVELFRKAGVESLVCCDLFDHVPFSERFDIVVADPPWYLDHYEAFIEARNSY